MKILTTEDVQEMTGKSQRVLWGMFKRGDIQAQLVGRDWATTEAAVNAYLSGKRYTLKPLYSAHTAAEHLGVNHWKIRRLVTGGHLTPAARIGGKGKKGTAVFTQRQLDNLDRGLLHRTGGTPADTTYDEYLVQEGGVWIVVGTRNADGVPYSSRYLRNVKPKAREAYSVQPVLNKGTQVRATTPKREAPSGIFTLAEDLLAGSKTVLVEDGEGRLIISVNQMTVLADEAPGQADAPLGEPWEEDELEVAMDEAIQVGNRAGLEPGIDT